MKPSTLAAGIVIFVIASIGFSSSTSSMGLEASASNSTIIEPVTVSDYVKISFGVSGLMGLGLVVYGVVAKEERKIEKYHCNYCKSSFSDIFQHESHIRKCLKNQNPKNLEYLMNPGQIKRKLIAGEITSEEYSELKRDFQI